MLVTLGIVPIIRCPKARALCAKATVAAVSICFGSILQSCNQVTASSLASLHIRVVTPFPEAKLCSVYRL